MDYMENYINEDGILNFGLNDKNAKIIDEFYKKNPFPNYKSYDNLNDFINESEKNIFVSNLKKFIGYNKKIVEIGSGTSQLGIYLAANTNNKVYCLDATLESLKLGKNFARKNDINNVFFLRADIEKKIFKKNDFDFVICTGVIHHTSNPYENFKYLSKLVRDNGRIIIGLYNKIGRTQTFLRQIIYKVIHFLGISTHLQNLITNYLDPYLRNNKLSIDKKNAWIKDQYDHPLEKSFTFDDLIKWFENNNIELTGSIPSLNLFVSSKTNLFELDYKTTYFERLFKQFLMIFNNYGKEGGLFIMSGKKFDDQKK